MVDHRIIKTLYALLDRMPIYRRFVESELNKKPREENFIFKSGYLVEKMLN